MIDESAFKTWLVQSGAQSTKAFKTRVSAIRKIEQKLQELDLPFRDLGEAWKKDRFETLYQRLIQIKNDARDGGQDYRILMPESENPHNRLSSWRSWLKKYGRFLDGELPKQDSDADRQAQPDKPKNIILHGPPGTGKTFHTAKLAVELCGEIVPKDRRELMRVYQQLVAAEQIEFVTFHQSMSYEEFVEGKQPTTESAEDSGNSSVGFRLEPVHGIFRKIAERAKSNRSRSTSGDAITVAGQPDRQVFKISIGKHYETALFDEAIDGGYMMIGHSNLDLSDDKYANDTEIKKACSEEKGTASHTPSIVSMFRNKVNIDDIVVVAKGSYEFQAIGVVKGHYEFRSRPDGTYLQRRAVNWLWVDRKGEPVTNIFANHFTARTIYPLPGNKLDISALERYMNGRQMSDPAEPKAYVLIIDEINRANISRVFGELITLLEPDKRLGQLNELKVRLPYSGDPFGVPSNLHILGTMNTADRSIALLDTALRRRFAFREMMPDPSLLAKAHEKCKINLPRILATINKRIEYLCDREKQIGHAYFIDCESRGDVDAVMRDKVIPLLAEYFFEDREKIAAVLGDADSRDGEITGGFFDRHALKAPPGLDAGDAPPRFRWEIRSEDQGFDYKKLEKEA